MTKHPSGLSSKYKEDSRHLLDSVCTIYSIQRKIYFSQQKRHEKTHTVTMIHPAACTKQLMFLSVCTQRQDCMLCRVSSMSCSSRKCMQIDKTIASKESGALSSHSRCVYICLSCWVCSAGWSRAVALQNVGR